MTFPERALGSRNAAPLNSSIKIGPGSRHEGIRTDLSEAPPWIQGYELSPLLSHYEIFHMGIVTADIHYQVSRVHSPYTHFIACLSGEGSLWTDGQFYQLKPGMACLLPRHSSHADCTAGNSAWQFCYVCYLTKNSVAGFHGLSRALVAEYNPLPLRHTIEALQHCCGPRSDAEGQRQLLGVVNHLVMRFIDRHSPDERFRLLWQRVVLAPAEDWSLERLEREAHCHREHLRRLCVTWAAVPSNTSPISACNRRPHCFPPRHGRWNTSRRKWATRTALRFPLRSRIGSKSARPSIVRITGKARPPALRRTVDCANELVVSNHSIFDRKF